MLEGAVCVRGCFHIIMCSTVRGRFRVWHYADSIVPYTNTPPHAFNSGASSHKNHSLMTEHLKNLAPSTFRQQMYSLLKNYPLIK